MNQLLRAFWLGILGLTSLVAFGQDAQVGSVEWDIVSEKIGDQEYKLTFTGTITEGWHMYTKKVYEGIDPLDLPLPSEYNFEKSADYELVGDPVEVNPHTTYDEMWAMDIETFHGPAIIEQKVKVLSGDLPKVKGTLTYQYCSNMSCMGEDFSFSFDLATNKWEDPTIVSGAELETLQAESDEFASEVIPAPVNLDLTNPINGCGGTGTDTQTYWGLFFFGLIFGFLSLFTPCVFPMIPLTVSFFTKGGQDRKKGIIKALIYGLSIVAVYVACSLPFYIPGTQTNILNQIATSAWLNLIFFAVFVIFALSFFGYFEIKLPSSWANKADAAADKKGGYLAAFFLAFVLAIVSFSCTGPLLGAVLGQSLSEGPVPITIAMLGFGLGLGVPFAIFAMFPAVLQSMPQSGGWLSTVKVVLGFVELGLAVKFLATADNVYHMGILKRETFYVVWIILAIACGLYLLGLYRFPHDSKGQKIGPVRMVFAAGFLLFGIYLVPGVMQRSNQWWNTKLIAGFPPPYTYSWYEYDHLVFYDYDEGMAYAREHNMPVFLDFTGYGCVNCRAMEEGVWPEDRVASALDKYVTISLYVDDRAKLPEDQQGSVLVEGFDGVKRETKIVTVGDKYSTFQTLRFKQVAQPYYVLMSPDEYMLTNPVAVMEADPYADWLECGLDAFQKMKSGEADLSNIDASNSDNVEVNALNPVTWEFGATKTGEGEYTLNLDPMLEEGWHIYSQYLESDEGPLATLVSFDENTGLEMIGQCEETDVHEAYEDAFGMNLKYLEGAPGMFQQKIKVTGALPLTVKGNINFMICNDGQCLPPTDQGFEIVINE